MPVSAEDAIWGATDKEMVRCTGSFSYAGWKLTGGKKPVIEEPSVMYDVPRYQVVHGELRRFRPVPIFSPTDDVQWWSRR